MRAHVLVSLVRVVLMVSVLSTVGCAANSVSPKTGSMTLTTDQLLSIADVAERMGDNQRAQQYLLAAKRSGAPAERVLPRLMRLLVEDGQYRMAIATLQEHLRAHPNDHRMRELLADLYNATALTANAITEYERVLSAEPKDASAHFALASLLREQGLDPGNADRHFREYLALAPSGEHAEEARSQLLSDVHAVDVHAVDVKDAKTEVTQ